MLVALTAYAQTISRIQSGMSSFKWGLTIVGIAIVLAALGVFLANPKDPAKALSPTVQWVAFFIIAAVGCGLIAYAWIGF